MSTPSKRMVMLADCQSFYASVEKAAHPQYADQPLVVAGDPERRSGIVLAACPIAKQHGVGTAERLGEALAKCPGLIVMKPRMAEYIRVSLHITDILQRFTDLVEPYSIDEQFIDVTGSLRLFGTFADIAAAIQEQVRQETGVYTRIGISENKVLAKMACDLYAKKNTSGIYHMPKNAIADSLWTMPIQKMFMIGSRMSQHLLRLGIRTIGDLAQYPLHRLRDIWGVNGEVIWRIANGMDATPVKPDTHEQQQAIGHQMTLPRDYATAEDLHVVLLELTELVCQRSRAKGLMGQVVAVGCQGADFDQPTGFYRQQKMPDPTHATAHVYATVRKLFRKHWNGLPVRKVGVTLTQLTRADEYQLCLFDEREKYRALEDATDQIKARFGDSAIVRAVSKTAAGQALDRSLKIGGHYK